MAAPMSKKFKYAMEQITTKHLPVIQEEQGKVVCIIIPKEGQPIYHGNSFMINILKLSEGELLSHPDMRRPDAPRPIGSQRLEPLPRIRTDVRELGVNEIRSTICKMIRLYGLPNYNDKIPPPCWPPGLPFRNLRGGYKRPQLEELITYINNYIIRDTSLPQNSHLTDSGSTSDISDQTPDNASDISSHSAPYHHMSPSESNSPETHSHRESSVPSEVSGVRRNKRRKVREISSPESSDDNSISPIVLPKRDAKRRKVAPISLPHASVHQLSDSDDFRGPSTSSHRVISATSRRKSPQISNRHSDTDNSISPSTSPHRPDWDISMSNKQRKLNKSIKMTAEKRHKPTINPLTRELAKLKSTKSGRIVREPQAYTASTYDC